MARDSDLLFSLGGARFAPRGGGVAENIVVPRGGVFAPRELNARARGGVYAPRELNARARGGV